MRTWGSHRRANSIINTNITVAVIVVIVITTTTTVVIIVVAGTTGYR